MDLKLKDKITKLLIESPGISISELAKRTGNYYSYTHKLIKEMQEKGLIIIKKEKKAGLKMALPFYLLFSKKDYLSYRSKHLNLI